VASTSSAAPWRRKACLILSMSSSPPSDQWIDEIDASATGGAAGRSIAASTAEVQSPSAGCATVSTVNPCAPAREIHSSTGEV
jgi:hypothetical protein